VGPDPDPNSDIPGMQLWGWMAPAELNWLMDKASQMDSVVEIGSLHGRSAYAMLTACPGLVYAIDPWDDEGEHGWRSFMGSCGHFPNLRAIRGFSPAVIETHNLPDVDMVFIDGDHKEASVRADIEGWLPKTRKLICGHDYVHGGGFPDVAVVVDEIFGDRVRVDDNTAIWYVELI
jgi:hypothetical protein